MSEVVKKIYEGYMVHILCGEISRKGELHYTERGTAKILITLTSPQASKHSKTGFFYNKNRIVLWGKNAEEIASKTKSANNETKENGTYISLLCRRSGGEVYPNTKSFGHSFTAERFKIWDNPLEVAKYFEEDLDFKFGEVLSISEVVGKI